MENFSSEEIRKTVRQNYGAIAARNKQEDSCCGGPAPADVDACCVEDAEAKVSGKGGCGCGSEASSKSACCGSTVNYTAEDISRSLGYSDNELGAVPEGANLGLGCGNPIAIASLKKGEIVLDLGSGAGFDAFLAARAVSEQGLVIGVDMTPEMVAKARENAAKIEASNVDFRLGEIEYLPVGSDIIDVIISNCVINLAPEKLKVFKEAYRVLKSGGRLSIADIVVTAELPEDVKNDLFYYSGCIAGASSLADIEAFLVESGFENISIKPKDESKEVIREWFPDRKLEEYVVSVMIEATKP